MSYDPNPYGLTAVSEQPSAPRRFTLTEQLEAEKRTLEDRLAQVTKVLEALKANPSFQELFDLISKYR